MNKRIHVSVCVWDFDGTFYNRQDALWADIRASEITVIRRHTGWSQEKAEAEFDKVYKIKTPSGTQSVSMLTGKPLAQIAQETAQLTNYTKYLSPDRKLQEMFEKLSHYTHYMLVNGTNYTITNGFALLGIRREIFKEIITSDFVGEAKPSQKGFLYILQKTGLPAHHHIMIGDREAVDLVPAKALGMKTCLVWADSKSEIADITLSTVYDMVTIL